MNFIKKIFSLRSRNPETESPAQVIETSPPPVISPVVLIDNIAFNHNLAKFFRPFSLNQLDGCYRIIKTFEKLGHQDIRWLAYALATTMHETAFTMQPVTEQGSEKYLKSKPYWPYIGRGYVQLTHKCNYEKYGIADDPEAACDPDMASFILINGMVNGIFTGRAFKHYFNSKISDPFNARKIINDLDKAPLVAGYYEKFLNILNNSKHEDVKLG